MHLKQIYIQEMYITIYLFIYSFIKDLLNIYCVPGEMTTNAVIKTAHKYSGTS